ncbi:unnamed protein product [Caenorhabditis angaria]|uniref:C-type lectin domain-containing protein n=1 Tax=Caenorhabditis angaria TaxID=860376 RepID=A0A9P1IPH3_9PELO|nr:unnamed protein product [Caenorhabditis angaria]
MKILLAFLEKDYTKVKMLITTSNFSPEHHKELQMLWLESHYSEETFRRNKVLTNVDNFRIRKSAPFPATIRTWNSIRYNIGEEAREILQEFFKTCKYPSQDQKKYLAHQTKLTYTQTLFSVGNYTCPDNYTMVSRTKGFYCIKVVASSSNYSDSEASCNLENSTLASIENVDEGSLILELAQLATSTSGYCWIGAIRLATCYGVNVASNQGCTPVKTNSFRWTDGFTVGTDGFSLFSTNEPTNLNGLQNCIGMVSSNEVWGSFVPGSMDDIACSTTTAVAHVCGQPATVVPVNCTTSCCS